MTALDIFLGVFVYPALALLVIGVVFFLVLAWVVSKASAEKKSTSAATEDTENTEKEKTLRSL